MPWYAIRSVYLFGSKADGKNVFEERVVVFGAVSWTQAQEKAAVEAAKYAEENNFVAYPERIGYEQDGSPLIDGYEVWSELFEANASLEEFYANRYAKFEHQPE